LDRETALLGPEKRLEYKETLLSKCYPEILAASKSKKEIVIIYFSQIIRRTQPSGNSGDLYEI
jgi:hypothetical protein